MNAAYENPQRIPLLFRGKLWGFLRLGICTYKLFFRFVYTDAQVGWVCKGPAGSLPSGLPIGVKAPCWHTIFRWKV